MGRGSTISGRGSKPYGRGSLINRRGSKMYWSGSLISGVEEQHTFRDGSTF